MKLRVFLAFLAVGLSAVLVLNAQEPSQPAKPKNDVKQLKDDLTLKQQILQRQFQEFEQSLLRLMQRLKASNKKEDQEKAVILEKALEKAKDSLIGTQFDQLVILLKTQQLKSLGEIKDAAAKSAKLAEDLRMILALLREDTRASRLRDERLRLEEMIKQIEKLIVKEKQVQGQTERGKTDKIELAKIQNKVAKETGDLAKKAGGQQGGEPKDSKSSPKDGGKAGGKQGDAKDAGKESKKGEGKDAGKTGDPKQGEAKTAQAGKGGDPKQGDAKSGKGGDPKSGAKGSKSGGKQGDPKDNQNAKGKEGESKDAGKEARVKEKKQGEAKSADKKDGAPKAGDKSAQAKAGQKSSDSKQGGAKASKSADSKSGGKAGDPPQGEAKAGKSGQSQAKGSGQSSPKQQPPAQQAQSKGDNQKQPPQQPQQPTPPTANAKKQIQDAEYKMKQAEDNIKQAKNEDATKDQDKAIKDLEAAKKKLEALLNQLREEELERLLAALQARCEKMLAMQLQVLAGTEQVWGAINTHKDKKASRTDQQASLKLSDDEKDIVVEATKAIEMLEAEGSAVAFPEVFKQVREDMKHVQRRLGVVDPGVVTQAIEKDIVETLKEMIEALKKKRQELDNKKSPPSNSPPPPPQDQKLLDQIAELKMIRSMQIRVNTRTKVYGAQYAGEQAGKADIVRELRNLSERQERIFEVTNRIAKGDNK